MQLAGKTNVDLSAKGVLTVTLKKCTNLEVGAPAWLAASLLHWQRAPLSGGSLPGVATKGALTCDALARRLQGSPNTYAVMTLYDPNHKPVPTIEYRSGAHAGPLVQACGMPAWPPGCCPRRVPYCMHRNQSRAVLCVQTW